MYGKLTPKNNDSESQ